jgi:two-component system sensor histidine kinase KdpD
MAIGVGAIAIITVVFALLGHNVSPTIPALLLLVPVTVTSVLTDRFIALAVAILAACVYALVFIPPVGAVRIGLTEDVIVLITFVLVALVVGMLKGRERERAARSLLDERRALLLRGVSHDLRSPLTTIHTISTELRRGIGHDDATRHELLDRVVHESERLDRIVGNLLSVSRVQAGALAPAIEPESLDQLVTAAVERLEPNERRRVLVDVPADLPDVLVDAVQVDQVLTNLLDNALRHGRPSGVVSILAEQVDRIVRVTVGDDGPGFAPDVRDHLFEPLLRSDQRRGGLGLTVCKAIIDAHTGTIWAGDSPGGGACVRFTLPIGASDEHGRRG